MSGLLVGGLVSVTLLAPSSCRARESQALEETVSIERQVRPASVD
jgi:hypothetical protein